MVKKAIGVFVLLCLVGSAAAYAKEARYDKELLKYGIFFSPPANWEKAVLDTKVPAVYYIRPDKQANISVRLPQAATLEAFNAACEALSASRRPLSVERTTFNGGPCYIFVFVVTAKSGAMIKTKDYQFFKSGMVYGIGYTSGLEGFEKHLPEFQKSLKAFSLKKQRS